MIKLCKSFQNKLAFLIDGEITPNQEEQWLKELEKVLLKFDKIDLMVVLKENSFWSAEAGITELKWLLKHIKRIKKVAIVSKSKIWKIIIIIDSIFARFVGIKEKFFEKEDEAWEWIKS